MKSGRAEELAMHPTVKPVALVADAIKDVSKRKGVVLDPFGGSGTTIIAAEKTGRRARAVELEPKYVDVAVRRWERYTGKTAVLDGTGQTFEDVEAARTAANDSAVARKEVA
jgi:DNA modification methylase